MRRPHPVARLLVVLLLAVARRGDGLPGLAAGARYRHAAARQRRCSAGASWRSELGCFTCHGPGGRGGVHNPGSEAGEVPSFHEGTIMMYAHDDQDLREYILDGAPAKKLARPAYVPGRAGPGAAHAGVPHVVSDAERSSCWSPICAPPPACSARRPSRRRAAPNWRRQRLLRLSRRDGRRRPAQPRFAEGLHPGLRRRRLRRAGRERRRAARLDRRRRHPAPARRTPPPASSSSASASRCRPSRPS